MTINHELVFYQLAVVAFQKIISLFCKIDHVLVRAINIMKRFEAFYSIYLNSTYSIFIESNLKWLFLSKVKFSLQNIRYKYLDRSPSMDKTYLDFALGHNTFVFLERTIIFLIFKDQKGMKKFFVPVFARLCVFFFRTYLFI